MLAIFLRECKFILCNFFVMEADNIVQSDYSFKVKYFQVEPEMRIRRYQYFLRMLVMTLCMLLVSFTIIWPLSGFVLLSSGNTFMLASLLLAILFVELLSSFVYYKVWTNLATKRCHDFGNDAKIARSIVLGVFISEAAVVCMTTISMLVKAPDLIAVVQKVAGGIGIIAMILGIVGYILAIILLLRPSNPGDNQYGKDPINTKVSFL